MADTYHYFDDAGVQQGPVTVLAFERLWSGGAVRGETHVWGDGMADWAPVNTVPALLSALLAVRMGGSGGGGGGGGGDDSGGAGGVLGAAAGGGGGGGGWSASYDTTSSASASAFATGDRVCVVGTSRGDLNGLRGTIADFDIAKVKPGGSRGSVYETGSRGTSRTLTVCEQSQASKQQRVKQGVAVWVAVCVAVCVAEGTAV